jgi:hypothetical protein
MSEKLYSAKLIFPGPLFFLLPGHLQKNLDGTSCLVQKTCGAGLFYPLLIAPGCQINQNKSLLIMYKPPFSGKNVLSLGYKTGF